MKVHLQIGLPPDLLAQAAQLYWQAFGGKLGRVMGPDIRAHRYLQRVIDPGQAIVALDDQQQLLGLAGFKTPEGSFAGGGWADMRAVYGLSALIWRAPLLALLSNDVDNDRFLLDGICVAPQARSLGIGSALMQAIEDEARRRGYAHVRLDVIDSNWRAKQLYQRLGFAAVKTEDIGLLRHAFGFRSVVTMVKAV